MSLRRKAETDGPSVFMSFHLGDIRLRLSSWLEQPWMSPRRMPLRRMSPRRRKAETEEDRDGCPRDGRYVFLNIMEGLSACYCLICFNGVFGLMKAVVCVRVVGWLGVHGCVWWRTGWQ